MFLVLFTLQLCGVIAWSWWWVAAPLLIWVGIPIAFILGLLAIGVFCHLIVRLMETIEKMQMK